VARKGLQVDVEQRGAGVAAKHLREMGDNAGDARPAFRRIEQELRREESHWFESRGGGAWAALDPVTAAHKGSGDILVASGRLRSSLTGSPHVEASRSVLRFGTDVPYARFHEYGTKSMPKRPPLVVPSLRVRRVMSDTIRRHLLEPYRR
jgi:phage gpG-like protein